MKSSPELNLARKWRPATFESVIGQELTVRLLKNSLFKQQFFPVYLLAGQRGCGKTTTGRIFAAAINCLQLDSFSKNPKIIIPCGTCISCSAMKQGNHPDFIEIDAASHTGVDNVRQLIEATSFLPHIGRKKIYLIDEAHMLSKAAFNAFLKILEEPPKTVLFMMATTDPHKIIDTVRSRCFQLFFDPVADAVLTDHLAAVCEQEGLSFEREGLKLVVRESEGSVRDALNCIERVRLAHDTLSKQAVLSTFGSLEDEAVVALVAAVAQADPAALSAVWQQYQLEHRPAQLVWKKLFDCLHGCLLIPYVPLHSNLKAYEEQLREISRHLPATRLVGCMELLYSCEQQFLKTTTQHMMLEMLLIKMCLPYPLHPSIHSSHARNTQDERMGGPLVVGDFADAKSYRTMQAEAASVVKKPQPLAAELPVGPALWWKQFVEQIDVIGDPLCASMIKQGLFQQADAAGTTWQVALPKDFAFLFEETIEKHRETWKKLLAQIAQKPIDIQFNCTLAKKQQEQPVRARPTPAPEVAARSTRSAGEKKIVDVSDATKWEKTHTLLALFPGAVSTAPDTEEDKGSTHE